jgi:hypothetical protein
MENVEIIRLSIQFDIILREEASYLSYYKPK